MEHLSWDEVTPDPKGPVYFDPLCCDNQSRNQTFGKVFRGYRELLRVSPQFPEAWHVTMIVFRGLPS